MTPMNDNKELKKQVARLQKLCTAIRNLDYDTTGCNPDAVIPDVEAIDYAIAALRAAPSTPPAPPPSPDAKLGEKRCKHGTLEGHCPDCPEGLGEYSGHQAHTKQAEQERMESAALTRPAAPGETFCREPRDPR